MARWRLYRAISRSSLCCDSRRIGYTAGFRYVRVVTRAWIGSDQGKQCEMRVLDVQDLLPAGHVAFEFQALVGQLDLSAFEAVYRADGRGRPPFDPRLMLTLILYCRSKGIMTGRAIAAACRDDVGARMITGNRYPQRSTVDRFIKTHARALKGLLSQTIQNAHKPPRCWPRSPIRTVSSMRSSSACTSGPSTATNS
jgi:transposase